jgi:hypothetical protein
MEDLVAPPQRSEMREKKLFELRTYGARAILGLK